MIAKIERAVRLLAYVAVSGFSILQGYSLIYQRKGSLTVSRALSAALVGRHVGVPGKQGQSPLLVFVLSTSCGFCAASSPFYRKLTAELPQRQGNGLLTIAVMPEEDSVARAYLTNTLHVSFDIVRQGRMLGVPATPTLLLIDRSGIIRNAWVGQLGAAEEANVRRAVAELVGSS